MTYLLISFSSEWPVNRSSNCQVNSCQKIVRSVGCNSLTLPEEYLRKIVFGFLRTTRRQKSYRSILCTSRQNPCPPSMMLLPQWKMSCYFIWFDSKLQWFLSIWQVGDTGGLVMIDILKISLYWLCHSQNPSGDININTILPIQLALKC